MGKLTTYNNILTVPILLTIIVAGVVIKNGLSYEPKYHFDLVGIGLIGAGLLLTAFELWDLRVLINFLQKDFNKKVIITDTEFKMIIGTTQKDYKLQDLKELELVDRVYGVRLWTRHLTYSKLKFSNSDEIILTSFISPIKEVEKLLDNRGITKRTRTRKRFELIN